MFGVALAYGLVELYAWYQTGKEPEPPGRESDPTKDSEAVVTESFVVLAGTHITGGKVELKGTTWNAENHCEGIRPGIGDRVRVVERRSLTLIVRPIDRSVSDRSRLSAGEWE